MTLVIGSDLYDVFLRIACALEEIRDELRTSDLLEEIRDELRKSDIKALRKKQLTKKMMVFDAEKQK